MTSERLGLLYDTASRLLEDMLGILLRLARRNDNGLFVRYHRSDAYPGIKTHRMSLSRDGTGIINTEDFRDNVTRWCFYKSAGNEDETGRTITAESSEMRRFVTTIPILQDFKRMLQSQRQLLGA